MELSGHKVLVTGGSAGIGLELARGFLHRGNRVAICGRDAARLSAARAELGSVETIECDLAKTADVDSLAARASDALDGLSILVNNAGVQLNFSFADVDPERAVVDVDREIRINFTSLVSLTARCLPFLRENAQAAVINVSSGLAIAPKSSAPVYCATKAAVHSFSQSLRYQMEDSLPNVRVVEVIPPLVDTDMTRGRGSGKISPEQVALETFRALERDRFEVRVGKVRLLAVVHRISPGLAARILRNS